MAGNSTNVGKSLVCCIFYCVVRLLWNFKTVWKLTNDEVL